MTKTTILNTENVKGTLGRMSRQDRGEWGEKCVEGLQLVSFILLVACCAGYQIPQAGADHLQGGEWPQFRSINPWESGCSISSPWRTWDGSASLPCTSQYSTWTEGCSRRGMCSSQPRKLPVFPWWIRPGGSFLRELPHVVSGTKWQSHLFHIARKYSFSMRAHIYEI